MYVTFKKGAMKNLLLSLTFLLASTLFIACSNDDNEDINPENPIEDTELKAAEAYFDNTLKSVINTNCTSCHTSYHSTGSSNYSVFTNARSKASSMYSQVDAGTMPKGGDKLSDDDINKFKTFKELVDAIP